MKKAIIILVLSAVIAVLLAACTGSPPTPSTTTEPATEFPPNSITINNIVVSDEAEIEITDCPVYGDKNMPYVYGKLTKGDPFDYEIITIIVVSGSYYGKKPYNNLPNTVISGDSTFKAQFCSNDGMGADFNAEFIYLFMVPTGYKDGIEPDSSLGYIVPPEQIAALKKDSICVVQINREIEIE